MYKRILKPIFFKFDPEFVHDFMMWFGEFLGKWTILKWKIGLFYDYKGKDISRVVDGIKYRTPFLLSAGFDYNARLMNILPSIGLGGEEIGSITARYCAGNPTPRLTRLPKSKSILVNKGLRNDGIETIINRIKKYKQNQKRYYLLRARKFFSKNFLGSRLDSLESPFEDNISSDFVIGTSIARTNDEKSASIEEGIKDYCYSFRRLNEENIGDYYTLNISCPNAYEGETFTNPDLLNRLLVAIKKIPCSKPIYVKMPINIPWNQFNSLLDIIDKHGLNGVIIGNLNKDYDNLDFREEAPKEYKGGTSGKPTNHLSTKLIRKTRELYGKRFTIIGCGGVMSVENAQEKFDAGADLIQLITGLIYHGPGLVKKLCKNVTI